MTGDDHYNAKANQFTSDIKPWALSIVQLNSTHYQIIANTRRYLV